MTTELRTTELRRGLVLASVGLVAGFVLIGVAASGTRLFSFSAPDEPHAAVSPPPVPTPAPAPTPLAALPAAPEGATTEPAGTPSFDVIRVEPDGASVLAGRGRPGAEIEVLRDGAPFARTKADESGNFALVPPALPPGSHEITLRSTAPDGATASSRASAVVAQDRRTKPLVAVTAPGRPTAVLSLPEPVKPLGGEGKPGARDARPDGKPLADNAKPQGRTRTQSADKPDAVQPGQAPHSSQVPQSSQAPQPSQAPVKVVGVDAEPGGRLYVTAQGAPKADLRLYLNDTLVAPGKAGPDGRVAFTIGSGVKPGDYRVRVDQVDPASGAVKTRAETAFAVPATLGPAPAVPGRPSPTRGSPAPVPTGVPSEAVSPAGATAAAAVRTPGADAALAPADPAATDPAAVFVPGISTATVTRGDNLWSISRKTYGNGLRYTVIFDANQGQIRDPNRIYPGQVFVLPGEAQQAREPESRG